MAKISFEVPSLAPQAVATVLMAAFAELGVNIQAATAPQAAPQAAPQPAPQPAPQAAQYAPQYAPQVAPAGVPMVAAPAGNDRLLKLFAQFAEKFGAPQAQAVTQHFGLPNIQAAAGPVADQIIDHCVRSLQSAGVPLAA